MRRQILIPKREEDTDERREQYNKQKRNAFVEKIKSIFKDRIGEENAICSWELFSKMFGNPNLHDLFKREFLWNMLRKMVTYLRNNTYFFIICYEDKWFIPKCESEGAYFTNKCKKEIGGLKNSIKRCNNYIKNEEWKKIEGKSRFPFQEPKAYHRSFRRLLA